MDSQLCLKWNNHSIAIDKLLTNLHLNELYSDVTISCQGNFYPVHRFILSTCSEYFHEMFLLCGRLNKQHPFIIIKDVHPLQMEAILNYMYKGEVNVTQSMLPDLLKAAEAFKIKGLAVPDDAEPPCKSFRKRSLNYNQSSSRKCKSRKIALQKTLLDAGTFGQSPENTTDTIISPENSSSISRSEDCDDISSNYRRHCSKSSSPEVDINLKSDNLCVKLEAEELIESFSQDPVDVLASIKIERSEIYNSNEEDQNMQDLGSKQLESSNYEVGNVPVRLKESSLDINNRLPPLTRVEQVLQSSSKPSKRDKFFSCSYCPYTSTDLSNRNRHVKTHTGESYFYCPDCPYSSIRKYRLIEHKKKFHPAQNIERSKFPVDELQRARVS